MANNSQPVRGQDIIDEVKAWIESLLIAIPGGSYSEGELASILIDSLINEDETYSLLITCIARGHRLVDWQSQKLLLDRVDDETETWIADIDTRGQVRFRSLPAGTYSFALISNNPPAPQPVKGSASLVAARGSSRQVYRTEDEPVTATVITDSDSSGTQITITFSTNEASLDGSVIQFTYYSSAGEVAGQEDLNMRLDPDAQPPRWTAVWRGKSASNGSGRLVYRVIRA